MMEVESTCTEAENSVPGKQTWHLLQAAQLEQFHVSKLYPPLALHKDLFSSSQVDQWLVPELAAALADWQSFFQLFSDIA
mmetsp:Transcript_86232/g.150502  ORF Transcript_86232/g.150502 Transcript_86232/m.150502 type:complete len:80 (-) Transcript_86232:216-455(-)